MDFIGGDLPVNWWQQQQQQQQQQRQQQRWAVGEMAVWNDEWTRELFILVGRSAAVTSDGFNGRSWPVQTRSVAISGLLRIIQS